MTRGGREQRAAQLPVGFFERDVATVARDLLGCELVCRLGGQLTRARLVEVEAYLGGSDPASHAAGYRVTPRNRAIYGPPGTWYVYLSYGVHWCANLVAGPPEEGAAVLLRAAEPLEGLAAMRRRRRVGNDRLLCSGPGRLCQALGVTRDRLDGVQMWRAPLRVRHGVEVDESQVRRGPRIGLTKARDWPLRFWVAGSRWCSRPG